MIKFFFAIVFFLVAACCVAQVKFTGGLMFGPVTSQISGDGLGGWDKFGFAAGAEVKMGFTEKSGITMGMQYITKGSKKPADVNNGDYNEFVYKLNYVDVPVMYNLIRDPWQFNLGLYAGVLLNQKADYNGGNYDINPPFEDLDLGAAGGVAFIANERWSFELRAQTSVIPTRPSPLFETSYYKRSTYNQVLQLMVHLKFGKGR